MPNWGELLRYLVDFYLVSQGYDDVRKEKRKFIIKKFREGIGPGGRGEVGEGPGGVEGGETAVRM